MATKVQIKRNTYAKEFLLDHAASIDYSWISVCSSCKAVTFNVADTQYSVSGRIWNSVLAKPKHPNKFGNCNYCVNLWGLDLQDC